MLGIARVEGGLQHNGTKGVAETMARIDVQITLTQMPVMSMERYRRTAVNDGSGLRASWRKGGLSVKVLPVCDCVSLWLGVGMYLCQHTYMHTHTSTLP
jgi:hypothetical protein